MHMWNPLNNLQLVQPQESFLFLSSCYCFHDLGWSLMNLDTFNLFSEPNKYGEIKGLASFTTSLPSPKAKLEIDESVCATNSPPPPPASYLCTVLGFAFKCRGQIFLFKIEKQCAPH